MCRQLQPIVTRAVIQAWERYGLGYPATEAVELVHDEVFDIMAAKASMLFSYSAYLEVVARRRARRLGLIELKRAKALAAAEKELSMTNKRASLEDIVDARLTLERVMDAWKGLSEVTQQALVGALSGMTAQQISDMTGISVFGIRKRIRQGRERLRQVAGREDERNAQSDSMVPPANQLVVDEGIHSIRRDGA